MNETYFDFLFLVIISLGLIIRIYPLLHFGIRNIDNYYHLLAARQIKKERQIPNQLSSFLFSGTYAYPPLFHILLSPLAGTFNKRREILVLLISPILDVLSAVPLYFLVGEILGKPIALLSALLYVATPLLVIESLSITPRTLGSLFLNIFILVVFLYAYSHNYWLIVASISCVPIILLSHKMATQSLFFTLILSSIVLLLFDLSISIFEIISLVIGTALTFVISRRTYLKVLRGHKAMLRYHFRHGNYKGEKRFGNPIQILQRWPWLVLMPLAFFTSSLQTFAARAIIIPLVWGLIFVALTVFWRYGDNYRYLVYGVAPLSIVFAFLIWSLPVPWTLILVTLSISLSAIRLIFFFSRRATEESIVTKDLLDCLVYIKNQESHASFGCIPVSLNYPSAFFTNKLILGAEAAPEPWEKGLDYSHFYKDESLLLELMSNYKTYLYLVSSTEPAGIAFESLLKDSKQIKSNLIHSRGRFKIYELHNETNSNEMVSDKEGTSASS